LLEAFTGWPRGLYAGSFDLLRQVPPRYTKATLCNSNVLHWPRMMHEFALAEAFDRHFASHLIGKIKPDEQAFLHVTDTLGCVAEEVLFLDDNDLNVEAAQTLGINAIRVRGVIEARQALTEAGVIST